MKEEKEELKLFRRKHGLSQVKLAELLPVSAQAIRNWEQGVYSPPPYLHRALNDLARELREVHK